MGNGAQNTRSEIAIYYLFSNNHINELISYRYDFRWERDCSSASAARKSCIVYAELVGETGAVEGTRAPAQLDSDPCTRGRIGISETA